MNCPQFLRLADQLSTLPPDVRRVVEALAIGDHKAAAAAAGGKGSRAPRSLAPRTASLFAD